MRFPPGIAIMAVTPAFEKMGKEAGQPPDLAAFSLPEHIFSAKYVHLIKGRDDREHDKIQPGNLKG